MNRRRFLSCLLWPFAAALPIAIPMQALAKESSLDALLRYLRRLSVADFEVSRTVLMPDAALLAIWVNAKAEYLAAIRMVEKYGVVVNGSSGNPVMSPWMTIVNRQARTLMELSHELRINPASRETGVNDALRL